MLAIDSNTVLLSPVDFFFSPKTEAACADDDWTPNLDVSDWPPKIGVPD